MSQLSEWVAAYRIGFDDHGNSWRQTAIIACLIHNRSVDAIYHAAGKKAPAGEYWDENMILPEKYQRDKERVSDDSVADYFSAMIAMEKGC